jgi:putative oxidoreductase
MKLFKIPALSNRVSIGLFILRLIAGIAFVIHGYGKIQTPFTWMGPDAPTPAILQGLAALSEFGGGLAWILGLLMPLASFGLACTMLVAASLHAFILGDPFVASGPGSGAYEPAAIYFCIAVLFLLTGPGRLSLDKKIFGEKS